MRSNDTPSSNQILSHRKSQKKINRSTGVIKPTTPLKGSEMKNFFIIKQLDKLENHVANYDVYKAMLDVDHGKELRKINMKKIKILNKFRHSDSIDEDSANESTQSKVGRSVKNRVKLNQTLELNRDDENILDVSKQSSRGRIKLATLANQ